MTQAFSRPQLRAGARRHLHDVRYPGMSPNLSGVINPAGVIMGQYFSNL